MLRQDYQGLHNELLLRIGEHYQQVFNGLSILASFASHDDPYQGPREITSPEQMVRMSKYSCSVLFNIFFLQSESEDNLIFSEHHLSEAKSGQKSGISY